jgi:hypothetical protein
MKLPNVFIYFNDSRQIACEMYFDKKELQDSENGKKVVEIADVVGFTSADPTSKGEENIIRMQFKKQSLLWRSLKQLEYLLKKDNINFNLILCLPNETQRIDLPIRYEIN